MPEQRNNPWRTFVNLPRFIIASAEWMGLSAREQSAFIFVAERYNGSNNGLIHCSARYLASRMRCSKSTAARALRGLCAKGFLQVVEKGMFDYGDRLAATYRIPLYKCDATEIEANPPVPFPKEDSRFY